MRYACGVLLLLGVVLGSAGCDVGESAAPPADDSTRVVDPAPTGTGEEYLEFGDTGAQPDALPGGGSPVTTSQYRLRVTDDGCTVRRNGEEGLDGLAWLVASADGSMTDPRGSRATFRPRLSGTGVVSVVLLDKTADGVIVHQVSNTVRVRCG